MSMRAADDNTEILLTEYLDGTLPPEKRSEIDAYLAAHPRERAVLDELIAQRRALGAVPRERAPADVLDAVQTRLERSTLLDGLDDIRHLGDTGRSRLSFRPTVLATAAMLLVSAGLATMVYLMVRKAPAPDDTLALGGTPTRHDLSPVTANPSGGAPVPGGAVSMSLGAPPPSRSPDAPAAKTTVADGAAPLPAVGMPAVGHSRPPASGGAVTPTGGYTTPGGHTPPAAGGPLPSIGSPSPARGVGSAGTGTTPPAGDRTPAVDGTLPRPAQAAIDANADRAAGGSRGESGRDAAPGEVASGAVVRSPTATLELRPNAAVTPPEPVAGPTDRDPTGGVAADARRVVLVVSDVARTRAEVESFLSTGGWGFARLGDNVLNDRGQAPVSTRTRSQPDNVVTPQAEGQAVEAPPVVRPVDAVERIVVRVEADQVEMLAFAIAQLARPGAPTGSGRDPNPADTGGAPATRPTTRTVGPAPAVTPGNPAAVGEALQTARVPLVVEIRTDNSTERAPDTAPPTSANTTPHDAAPTTAPATAPTTSP